MARPAPGQIDERSRIHTALGYIPADHRELWLRIGMAINSALGVEEAPRGFRNGLLHGALMRLNSLVA
jgi:hypothetical protein